MKRPNRPSLFGGVLVLALAAALSCSRRAEETTTLEMPRLFDEAAVGRANSLVNEAYGLAESGDYDGALAKFAAVEEIVPTGRVGAYNSACVEARRGDTEEGLRLLTTAVDNGYDNLVWLEGDPDLEPLRGDPRFDELVRRAAENYENATAVLRAGMPDPAPGAFASLDELEQWSDGETRALRANRTFLTTAAYLVGRVVQTATYLAAKRDLSGDDPAFDYDLERIRAASRIQSPYEPGWGNLSDMIVREVDDYVASAPDPAAAAEARYLAATALSLRYGENDPNRDDGFERAAAYLAAVGPDGEYAGAARALALVNQMQTTGADFEVLGPRFRAVVEAYPDDNLVRRVISTRMNQDAARFLWPLPIDATDLDGDAVKLADYRGKVLLIDFWATWCPPCRAELPGLVETYRKLHPRGFEVLSISLDRPEDTTVDDYRAWIGEHEMSWRHVYDGDAWNSPLVKRFFVGSIPSPFLVGADGSLVAWGEDCRGENLGPTVEKALDSI